MKKGLSYREATMGPVQQKTFSSALDLFFKNECPQFGGSRTRAAIISAIMELVEKYYPRHSHLRMGQVLWPAVDINETSSYGKKLSETQQVPVFLDLISEDDIQAYLKGEKAKSIKQKAAVRLCKQAKSQGGVLSCSDVAAMLKLSPGTIAKYLREWDKQNNCLVPRRGTIHDMGPTLTHKKSICYKVIIEGKTVEQVQRETNHTPEAITRYVCDYKRIDTCLKIGMSVDETAYATDNSKNLVKEYEELIKEYNDINFNIEDN